MSNDEQAAAGKESNMRLHQSLLLILVLLTHCSSLGFFWVFFFFFFFLPKPHKDSSFLCVQVQHGNRTLQLVHTLLFPDV